jgi:hypothetical protein
MQFCNTEFAEFGLHSRSQPTPSNTTIPTDQTLQLSSVPEQTAVLRLVQGDNFEYGWLRSNGSPVRVDLVLPMETLEEAAFVRAMMENDQANDGYVSVELWLQYSNWPEVLVTRHLC